MFYNSNFNKDLTQWNVINVENMKSIFNGSYVNERPYWYFPTQEERVDSILKKRVQDEQKHIEKAIKILKDVQPLKQRPKL